MALERPLRDIGPRRPGGKKGAAAVSSSLGLQVEALEDRLYLSANPVLDSIVVAPALTLIPNATTSGPYGLTPAQVRHAYGFDQITFGGGKIHGDGTGQTIAIVDAYDDPNIAADLHKFDQQFGLPDPSFTKYQQKVNGKLPSVNAGWAGEIALDVEWAHAIAPGAKILLVEAFDSSLTNLIAAVDYARSQVGVSVVSMSWGANEFRSETAYDSHFLTPAGHAPVAFVASSGDSGAGAIWPASSPNVLGVGGTTLTVSSNGTYGSETAWAGSGGGKSAYETEPTYQNGVQHTKSRTAPDVAYDANPNTGFAVYDSVAYGGRSGWLMFGGTSAGAPQWAALVAIADQGRALLGKATLGNLGTTIYGLSSADFHDISKGSNGLAATAGYDQVTGLGSPIANFVVRDLVGTATTTTTSATTHTTTITVLVGQHIEFADGSAIDQEAAFALAVTPGTRGGAGSPVSASAQWSALLTGALVTRSTANDAGSPAQFGLGSAGLPEDSLAAAPVASLGTTNFSHAPGVHSQALPADTLAGGMVANEFGWHFDRFAAVAECLATDDWHDDVAVDVPNTEPAAETADSLPAAWVVAGVVLAGSQSWLTDASRRRALSLAG